MKNVLRYAYHGSYISRIFLSLHLTLFKAFGLGGGLHGPFHPGSAPGARPKRKARLPVAGYVRTWRPVQTRPRGARIVPLTIRTEVAHGACAPEVAVVKGPTGGAGGVPTGALQAGVSKFTETPDVAGGTEAGEGGTLIRHAGAATAVTARVESACLESEAVLAAVARRTGAYIPTGGVAAHAAVLAGALYALVVGLAEVAIVARWAATNKPWRSAGPLTRPSHTGVGGTDFFGHNRQNVN